MKTMPFLTKTILAATLAALPFQAFAQDATGETIVNIRIPGRLIFEYYATVNVDIPANVFDQIVLGGDIDNAANGPQGATLELEAMNDNGDFSIDAEIDLVDPTATLTNLTLVLNNVWSLAANRDGTITPSITTAILDHEDDGSSSITLSNILVSSSTNTTAANPFTFERTGLGANSAMSGNVHLTLNLTNALAAGLYEGGVYELAIDLD